MSETKIEKQDNKLVTKEQPRQRGVTIVDVAKAAGVGRMTVSRFFSSRDKVSPEMQKRIAKVVDDLGYVPSPTARALASKRSDIIGVVIPSITNDVFSDVLSGVYEVFKNTKHNIQIGNFQYDPLEEEKIVRSLLLQNPSGIIVTGVDQTKSCREILKKAQCTVVQTMEYTSNPIDLLVGLDHGAAVHAALQHLIEQGYRFPAFLAGREDPRVIRRRDAFERFCQAQGIDAESRIFSSKDHSSTGLGRVLLDEVLAQSPDTDCIFCNNDDIALGVLFECLRKGLRVPEDVAICGFNDLEVARNAHPSITSIHTNRLEMGRIAAQMLLSSIRGEAIETSSVNIGFEVRMRETTRAAQA